MHGVKCYEHLVHLSLMHAAVPEVETTATETLVYIGSDITITCSVRRGNPFNYIFTITNTDTGSTTTGPTRTLTSVHMSDLGTYRCDVTNDAGTGSSIVTIELGGKYVYSRIYFRNQSEFGEL